MKTNSPFNSETYMAFYKANASEDVLHRTLERMPAQYGVKVADKKALAEECMRAVIDYEYIRDCVADGNLIRVLDEAFDNCATNYYERMYRLHRANFGLSQFESAESLEFFRTRHTSTDFEKLFEDYMKQDEKAPLSETELRQAIVNRISHNSLSTDLLIKYAESFKDKNENLLKRSRDLSQNSYEAKCIASMDEYLRGNNESMAAAACKACEEADLQAYSAAILTGQISEKDFKKKMSSLCTVVVLLSFVLLLVSDISASLIVEVVCLAGALLLTVASIIGIILVDFFPNFTMAHGASEAKLSYDNAVARAEAEDTYIENDYTHDLLTNEDYSLHELKI